MQLQEIGLTKREQKVYLALLELGITTTGPLIKKSQIPNSKIYETLQLLQQKGLVSYIIKGKTKHFQASNPKQILTLYKEKERKLEQLIKNLQQKQLKPKQLHSVELFEDYKAIRNMLISLIENSKKENWYGFSTGNYKNKKIAEFYEWWGAKKASYNLKDHLLISLKNKTNFETIHKDTLKHMKKTLKFSKISFPGDTAIFQDKVIIFNLSEESQTAILITSKDLSEQYKNFFRDLWKIAKP